MIQEKGRTDMDTPEIYMQHALRLAARAAGEGEVPVGAVIVRRGTGEIVGEGWNRRETARHALAHAELMAIDAACRRLGGWRLPDCAMFVTLEPCPMCAGGIIQARIDPKSGAVQSVETMFALPYNYRPEVHTGLMQDECSAILSDFFRALRERRRAAKQSP